MAFSSSRRPYEMDDFGAIDELQLGERHDAIFVQRGLERKVEAGKRLDCGQARHLESHFDATVLSYCEFLNKKKIDVFDRRRFAALHAAYRDVEDLEGARHLQTDEIALDAIDDGLARAAHRTAPWLARRRPTAS